MTLPDHSRLLHRQLLRVYRGKATATEVIASLFLLPAADRAAWRKYTHRGVPRRVSHFLAVITCCMCSNVGDRKWPEPYKPTSDKSLSLLSYSSSSGQCSAGVSKLRGFGAGSRIAEHFSDLCQKERALFEYNDVLERRRKTLRHCIGGSKQCHLAAKCSPRRLPILV